MPKENEVGFIDAAGQRQEVALNMDIYAEAQQQEITVEQLLNRSHATRPGDASAFNQMVASSGLFLRGDPKIGVKPPSVADIMSGRSTIDMQGITRSGGSSIGTPASRLLFPEVVMRHIESELGASDDQFLSSVDKMVAISSNVTTARVEQPIINVTPPAGTKSEAIAQLAKPVSMMTITTSDSSYRIPTYSIGLEISEEAKQSTTLDLIGLALGANSRQQSITRVESDLKAMILGDSDIGEKAVTGVNASTFDASITRDKGITQAGWVKFLHKDYRKRSLDWLIMSIDTALAIENRSGKPVITTDNPNSPRIDALFTVDNLSIQAPRVLIVEDAIVGANVVVGLDSRYAIRKVVNVSATYQAVEEFVLRKATALRLDYGQIMKKLYPDAWTSMTLGQ